MAVANFYPTAAHDAILLFWIGMLALWALVAVSFLYGRLWCGWVCLSQRHNFNGVPIPARWKRVCTRTTEAACWAVLRGNWIERRCGIMIDQECQVLPEGEEP